MSVVVNEAPNNGGRRLQAADFDDLHSYVSRIFAHDLEDYTNERRAENARTFPWEIDDSCLARYTALIRGGNDGLFGILDRHVGKSPSNAGLDIAGGSNGVALQELMSRGYIGRGVLTNYMDHRSQEARKGNFSLVTGDLAVKATWRSLWLKQQTEAPGGFAIVMHRPVGALQNYPPSAYIGLTGLVLAMMKPGGVFFTQIPNEFRHVEHAPKTREYLRQLHQLPGMGHIKFLQQPERITKFCVIQKDPDSPVLS